MTPNFSDASPRYVQIADLMRQRIGRGHWQVGDKLPAQDELVSEFSVARVTVRQAMDLLTREGLISPQQGRGTFITALPERHSWLKVQTSLDELAQAYRDDKPEIITMDESLTSAPLRPGEGIAADRYVFMRRTHAKDAQPYCVINLYLDEQIFRKAPERFRSETVIPIINAMGEDVVAHAHQVLTIGTADMEVARMLKVPVNAPVAEVRRVFTDAAGRVIYLGEVTYRGDFIHLQMTLK